MPFMIPALAAIGTAFGGTAAVAATATTAAVAGTAVSTGALVVGTAASVAAGGVSAYSQYQAGKSAGALNDYNAALMSQSAQTNERDAAIQANAQRRNNERIMAKQRAGFAGSGVVGSSGSPLLVEAEQAGYLEMNALETQRQGAVRSGALRQQSDLDRMQGGAARRTGSLNAAGTILSTAGSIGSAYYGVK